MWLVLVEHHRGHFVVTEQQVLHLQFQREYTEQVGIRPAPIVSYTAHLRMHFGVSTSQNTSFVPYVHMIAFEPTRL